MSKAQVVVELEGGQSAFLPGDEVAGVIRLLTPEGPVKCRKVTAQLRWRTEGKGDTDKGGPEAVEIFAGPVIEGAMELAFRQKLPLGPSSYNGVIIKVIWSVHVRVDQPWAKDSLHDHTIMIA